MTDLEFERGLLERLLANTRNEVPAPGWFIGDKAGLRQMNDDLLSGSIFLRTAHERAREGLAAIERKELDLAKLYRREAERLLSEARGLALPADRLEALRKGAERRGKKPATTDERDLAFAVAVEKQVPQKGAAAWRSAIRSDSYLKNEFSGLTDHAKRKALRRGNQLLAKKKT